MPTPSGRIPPARGGPRVAASLKAGVIFPVSRIRQGIRLQAGTGMGHSTKSGRKTSKIRPVNVSTSAGVFLAGVVDYMVQELFECAGKRARSSQRCRIAPRHISGAIANDAELLRYMEINRVDIGEIYLPDASPQIDVGLTSDAVIKTKTKKKKAVAAE